jgi:signal transduction histidine kinase
MTDGSELRPLSEGNRFQRAYARWAEPYYHRMSAEMQAEARRLDAWLYGRAGMGLWAGLMCAIAGSALGLRSAGLPTWLAIVLSLSIWIGLGIAALGAWMAPERFTPRRIVRVGLGLLAGAVLGLLSGFLIGRTARFGGLALDTLGEALADLARKATPALLALSAVLAVLLWLVASSRRWQTQRELAQLRLVQERDAAAREAAEAQLKLLRAQIQPHFIFNTLAALQHWVDSGDARAPGLLRSLTAFLRGSTELLGRDEVLLRDEASMVGHYLAIQQARLGTRLSSSIDVEPAAAMLTLPPGVLLTLVENAVEHGLTPAVSGGTVAVRIRLDADGLDVCVADTGVGPAAGWAEGVGLANCRQRLAHRFGDRARLTLSPQSPGTLARIRVQGSPP